MRPAQTSGAGSAPEDVYIVLSMNVRDEEAIVARCLEHALPHVDGYVICDTGSRDRTVAMIEEITARAGTPGRVLRHAWRDFGHNRTLAAREGRAWVVERGWPPERTYLLFLDADMVLRVDPTFDKRQLSASCYALAQRNGSLRYVNLRLARLSHDWEAVGPTHEYWRPGGDAVHPARLETMHIDDLGDGGRRSGKFVRDIRLLRQGLAREPENARFTFYLAQSYFDLGLWPEAAAWYERRWRLGGWDEERWYARFRQGLCLLRLGDAGHGTDLLLQAFEARPTRAEPMWALAQHHRTRGLHRAALMFALRGLEIPLHTTDELFVDQDVHEWRLWEEIMISAFYAGPEHHQLGRSACERLLARRGHDARFYDYVARNLAFYRDRELTIRGIAGDRPGPPAILPPTTVS